MSYILDALNKAERERGAKRVPALLAEHDFQTMRGSRLWLVTGVLVVCAAAAIWFFLPARATVSRTSESAGTGAAQRTGVEPSGEAVHANTEPLPNLPPDHPAPEHPALSKGVSVPAGLQPGVVSTPAPVLAITGDSQKGGAKENAAAVRRPAPSVQTVAPSQPNPPESQVLPSSDQVSPQAQSSAIADDGATGEKASRPRVVENKAASLREALDKMTISVLMYAEAQSDRRVYINGRKYVEGDYVDGRYLVEKITLEGVVLSFEGERALLRSGSK